MVNRNVWDDDAPPSWDPSKTDPEKLRRIDQRFTASHDVTANLIAAFNSRRVGDRGMCCLVIGVNSGLVLG